MRPYLDLLRREKDFRRTYLAQLIALGGDWFAIIPLLILLRVAPGEWAPLALALAVGIAINIPFAVLVKLAQDYLPTRPGTAAGVTLGLAMSAGGLFAPVYGLVAEAHGPEGVFTVLCAVPVAAVVLGIFLKRP